MTQDALVARLREQIEELARQVEDLTRHNKELRDTVAALLSTTPPPGNFG